MRLLRRLYRPVLQAILVLLCAGLGSATTIDSYNGTFTWDNEVQYFGLSLTNPSRVIIQTWSFGGTWEAGDPGAGDPDRPLTNAEGQPVEAGGFYPYLALYDASGTQVAENQAGCGLCRPDPVTGGTYTYDAYINRLLDPGAYLLVLTEYNNVPGVLLSDGFQYPDDPIFTLAFFHAENSEQQPPPFLLYESGEKRTGNWAVDITLDEVPEPASLALVATGLVLLLAPRAFRARRLPRV